MKIIKRIVSLTIPLLVVGCTTLSEKAASVQFHSQMSNALDGCTRIAPLTVTINRFSIRSRDQISVALREAAADAGGDTVVALNMDETLTEYIQQGIAYSCYE